MNPIMKLSISIAANLICLTAPIVIDKISEARAEKKRLIDENIFVLKPEIRI